jgi:hypothetical protein
VAIWIDSSQNLTFDHYSDFETHAAVTNFGGFGAMGVSNDSFVGKPVGISHINNNLMGFGVIDFSDVSQTTTNAKLTLNTSTGATDIVGALTLSGSGTILAGSGASGILTLGGTGGTNNENITFDFESTADKVIIGTGTGLKDWDFNAFQQILMNNGAGSRPAYSFSGDEDTGIYRPNADRLNLVIGGTSAIQLLSGNAIFSTINLTFDNNKTFQIKDSGGVIRQVLKFTNQEVFEIGPVGSQAGKTTYMDFYPGGFNKALRITEGLDLQIPNDAAKLSLGGGVDADSYFAFDSARLDIFSVGGFDFMTAADTDLVINFIGTTNSGLLTWMEDEDYFKFSDEILMDTAEKINFRDTAIGIYSQADTFLDLFADGAVRIGDSSAGAPTNYVEIESDADVNFVAGAGLQFGEIYYHGSGTDLALAAQDTWYQLVAFDTDGEANGSVTPDHTNDHITVGKAGRYLVSYSISSRSAASNKYEYSVFYNNGGTEVVNSHTHRDTTVANKLGVVANSCIVDLPASATVELWVQRADGGAVSKTITTEHITLNVVQIGGTT